jgi:hypothetical protein
MKHWPIRAWPHFKKPAIETHGKPCVEGETTRDEAINNVVSAIK